MMSFFAKACVFLFTLSITSFKLNAGENQIHFKQNHFDLGVIERNRQPRFFTFDLPIVNPTNTKAKILKAQGNCNCFTVEKQSNSIPASGSASLRVSIDKYSAKNKTNYTVAVAFDNGDVITASFSMLLLDKVRLSPERPHTIITKNALVTGRSVLVARTFALGVDEKFEIQDPTITLFGQAKSQSNIDFKISAISSEQLMFPKRKVVVSIYKIEPIMNEDISKIEGRIDIPMTIRWADGVSREMRWQFEKRAMPIPIVLEARVQENETQVAIALTRLRQLGVKNDFFWGVFGPLDTSLLSWSDRHRLQNAL